MSDISFDPLAVAVDWLDACRARDLPKLLSLYDASGTHHCACEGGRVYAGRASLSSYWAARFDRAVPRAFDLLDIAPAPDGVLLDHSAYDGTPVRVCFAFTKTGRIGQSICRFA